MPTLEGFRVATAYVALTIEEQDVQAQIEDAVTSACQQAGEDGGTLLTQELAAAVEEGAPDLSGPLADSLAGAGDVAASEIAGFLTDRIGVAGDDGGAELAAALQAAGAEAGGEIAGSLTGHIGAAGDEGGVELATALQAATAETGSEIAQQVGGQLDAELPLSASAAGAELATELTAATAHVGDTIANQISHQLTDGLDVAAQDAAAALGQLSIPGASGLLGAAASGAGIAGALAAAVADAAAEAGGIAGVELSRNLSEAAVAALSSEDFDAFVSQLVASASAAGDAAGAAAADGLEAGLTSATGALPVLAETVTEAAAEAGDAAGAQLLRSLSEAAIAAMSDEEFDAFTAQLVATADEAGAAAGIAAADAMEAAFASAFTGVDLISSGLSTTGRPMAAAQEYVEAADEVLAAEEATLTGTRAYEAELDAVFQAIYGNGSKMSVDLAAAMTEAFQGIEADTSEFTTTELAIFEEFYQTLQEQGDQAALDLAERISVVSSAQMALMGRDLIGEGVSTLGQPMPAATALEEQLGGVEKGAAGASESLGGMAGIMSGPWAFAAMGAMSILPMFSTLLGGNSQAAQQAAQMHQQLAQAIGQDSGAVGDNTVVMLDNALAQSGLLSLTQQLGVSQIQLLEATAGESDAQGQVSAAYDAKTAALAKTQTGQENLGRSVVLSNVSQWAEMNQLHDSKTALDNLTTSVQQTIQAHSAQTEALVAAESTTQIYTAAVANLVDQQKASAVQAEMQADATGAYLMTVVPGTQAYVSVLDSQVIALEQSSVNAQINAQAMNDSLGPLGQLTSTAVTAAANYQNMSGAASQYTGALTALFGQYGTTSAAQATFTTDLDNLKGKITDGKNAVDLNTAAGAANFQQFQQVASAAETYAEKLYQQTGNADQASQALQDMAGKLDTAASKAGLTKQQVQDLNTELFGVPNIKDITVKLDPTPAEQGMTDLQKFITGEINDINTKVIAPKVSVHSGLTYNATGGPVQAGVPTVVGDGGRPELFIPNSDGRIYPSVAAGAQALGGRGGGGVTVYQTFNGSQAPTPEQQAIFMRQLAMAVHP